MAADTRDISVPIEVLEAIRAVVDYDWQVEARDYAEQDEEDQPHHVFLKLSIIDQWLDVDGLSDPDPLKSFLGRVD